MNTTFKQKVNNLIRTSLTLGILLVSGLYHNAFSQQQNVGIIGIDHVGINVPNLEKAVAFFTDVLKFTPVTQLGPVSLDDNWKKNNYMQLGTGAVTIKMILAGTGANIELFEYQNNQGNQQQPGGDDIGATHIAFYTNDITAGVAYLKSKGVKVLGDPFLMPSGDTEGESWVYFETPWGSKMELVSYPNGKGYEKHHPKAILWSPKNKESKARSSDSDLLSAQETQTLIKQHLAIWNEKNLSKRNVLMNQVYAPNIEMVDRHFVATGYNEINEFVNSLQQKNPDYKFRTIKLETHHNIARLFWQVGSTTRPNAVSGMDLFVIQNGKIQQLYVFVN